LDLFFCFFVTKTNIQMHQPLQCGKFIDQVLERFNCQPNKPCRLRPPCLPNRQCSGIFTQNMTNSRFTELSDQRWETLHSNCIDPISTVPDHITFHSPNRKHWGQCFDLIWKNNLPFKVCGKPLLPSSPRPRIPRPNNPPQPSTCQKRLQDTLIHLPSNDLLHCLDPKYLKQHRSEDYMIFQYTLPSLLRKKSVIIVLGTQALIRFFQIRMIGDMLRSRAPTMLVHNAYLWLHLVQRPPTFITFKTFPRSNYVTWKQFRMDTTEVEIFSLLPMIETLRTYLPKRNV